MKIGKGFAAAAALAVAASGLSAEQAEARQPGEIYGPVFAKYKSITDARKKLRDMEKKGSPMSGDEIYAMAAACNYEEPESRSIILTALSRSRCKDKVGEYYVRAGMNGTPEGFLAAARSIGSGDGAFLYAQAAYQLAGNDSALKNEALDLLASLRSSVTNMELARNQASALAAEMVEAGQYRIAAAAPGEADLANVVPELNWLDFTNPKRCGWSGASNDVIAGAWRFDDETFRIYPATVEAPGIEQPVTGRISRPERDAPNYVVVDVDFKGRWNGLTVLGLQDAFLEESHGVYGRAIRFVEPVDQVARILSQQGFVVNADGSERRQVDRVERMRYVDENGRQQVAESIDGVVTSIERVNGETVFFCNEMFEASYGDG